MDDPGERRPRAGEAHSENDHLVGVVGPCCAGKTTLVKALCAHGYAARVIAQEHSFTPYMWQVITRPDTLIYLDVSYPVAQQRRWMNWTAEDLEEQHRRLQHARDNCHLYLHTDALSPEQVYERVAAFLSQTTS
jgi:deoxyadenosine/deoxycytidine kinase